MKTLFGIDTEDLPTPDRPEGTFCPSPHVYDIPFLFNQGVLTVFWPDGSPWMITREVENRDEAIHHFCLRAFWSLAPEERVFALRTWRESRPADLPETRTLPITDLELMTLLLLEYAEEEAAYRKHHRPLIPAGKCPAFEAFFPTMN